MSSLKFLCVLLLVQVQAVCAGGPTYEELQAAYIQKFIGYIEWPSSKSPIFIVGVLQNKDEFKAMQNALENKKIQDRQVVVMDLDTLDSAKQYEIVHIKSIDDSIEKQLRKLSTQPTLVISQDLESLTKEVIINFFLEDGKLRFDINIERANELNFKINSRLLKLARKLK